MNMIQLRRPSNKIEIKFQHLPSSTSSFNFLLRVSGRTHFNYPFPSSFCGDHVIFAGPLRPHFEVVPRGSARAKLTIKLRNLETWDRLSENDLTYNDVRPAVSPRFLREFQGRLQRKRYIDDGIAEVRTLLPCYRPPDLCCSSYMRYSGTICNGI